ncbi:histidine kinase [Pedobacter sp. GSP4]|uniref:histidine kinase n=1 Tax=Pedobacter sp. GSP4 TaxID=3453716 RepID=UPI003EECC503
MDSFKQHNTLIKNWLIRYRVHIIVWTCFIFWESILTGLIFGAFGKLGNYVIHYIINISLFYIHVWLLEKTTVFPRQALWKVPVFVILELAIYTFGVLGMDLLLVKYTNLIPPGVISITERILRLLWRSSFFLLFSTGYFFLKRFASERTEKQRIEKQRFQMLIDKERMDKELIMSKNAFLKAQINPHLLFNTFEFIHQKIRQYSPEDAQVMIYLSDMMRFAAATEHNEGFVKLSDEVTQCQNLIQLHQITQGKVFIELAYSPDVLEIKLIPLVLLTLLENMFKHGNLFDAYNKATIDVYIMDGELKMESRNLPSLVKSTVGFGSGLDNIKSRLDYSYGDDAQITAHIDEDSFYTLSISIALNALQEAFPMQVLKVNEAT